MRKNCLHGWAVLALIVSHIVHAEHASLADNCVVSDTVGNYNCVAPSRRDNHASHTEKRLYIGLAWALGSGARSIIPAVNLGYSSLKVSSDNGLHGVDISARISYANSQLKLDSTRLFYVHGERDLMTLYGAGYAVNKNDFMGALAVQKSHLRLGTDVLLQQQTLHPYIEINSLDTPARVDPNTDTACSNQGDIVAEQMITHYDSGNYSHSEIFSNGQTCAHVLPTIILDLDLDFMR